MPQCRMTRAIGFRRLRNCDGATKRLVTRRFNAAEAVVITVWMPAAPQYHSRYGHSQGTVRTPSPENRAGCKPPSRA
jgi:hypothetical protein